VGRIGWPSRGRGDRGRFLGGGHLGERLLDDSGGRLGRGRRLLGRLGRLLRLLGLDVALEALALGLAAHAIGLRVLDARRVALDPDTERAAEIERLLVGEPELAR
jgi:hypothetical protein